MRNPKQYQNSNVQNFVTVWGIDYLFWMLISKAFEFVSGIEIRISNFHVSD